MPELVIHVGDCKAGSTSIQSVLARRAWSAPSGGPGRTLRYAAAGRGGALNHHALANALFVEAAKPNAAALYARLAGELKVAQAPCVLSSERFEFAPPGALAEALAAAAPAARLRLIAYVRPHAERLLSGYAQQVKQGLFRGDVAAFHAAMRAEGRFRFAPRLRAWRETFGEALEVRPMIRERLVAGCAAHDFLAWAAGPEAAPTGPVEANRTPSAGDLALLAELHARAGPQAARAAERLTAAMEADPEPEAPRPWLDRATAEAIARDYAEDAAALDAEIFGETILAPRLATAVEGAREAAMPASAEAWRSPETRRVNALWIAALFPDPAPSGDLRLARAGE